VALEEKKEWVVWNLREEMLLLLLFLILPLLSILKNQ